MLGADEAGKGPVLGSMFGAAVRAPPEAVPAGVEDSKRLSADRREELAAALQDDERIELAVAEIPVERIDGGADMNTLTVAAQAEALGTLARDGDAAVVDAGDTDADRFGARVADRLPVSLEVRAEHGADASVPVVSAASVVAKVRRDAHVDALAAEYGDVGSGYPSDGQTRRFLREYLAEHGALPDCARRSWQTSTDLLAAAEQSRLDTF